MNRFLIGIVLAAVLVVSSQAFEQNVPSVVGVTPFSPPARYMSLAGFLRWQYFTENGVWLSIQEAQELVNNQLGE